MIKMSEVILICKLLVLPVNDALFVQEFQSGDDFGRVKPGPILFETPALLDVEHEIAAVQILHHEEQVRLFQRSQVQRSQVNKLIDNFYFFILILILMIFLFYFILIKSFIYFSFN